MPTYKLSPSSLSLMHECPRCFWLTQHGVWKRPAGIFPSLPSGMDFDKAWDLVRKKVPISQISMDLIDFIKENY